MKKLTKITAIFLLVCGCSFACSCSIFDSLFLASESSVERSSDISAEVSSEEESLEDSEDVSVESSSEEESSEDSEDVSVESSSEEESSEDSTNGGTWTEEMPLD